MAGKIKIQETLQQPYVRAVLIKEVFRPVFGDRLNIYRDDHSETAELTATEKKLIKSVVVFGQLDLEDGAELRCYEVHLQQNVKLEYNRVSIQQYVRKLLTAGQAVLVSFIPYKKTDIWRLTLVASDSVLTEDGVQETKTNAKRYTYLLGPNETGRTAAERFAELEAAKEITLETLVKAFSVEKLSKSFFDEYKRHYEFFVSYLTKSAFKRSVFNGDEKAIRDFVKKMLGRIVFLYFVQKKGWLGASDTDYNDGDIDFIFNLFQMCNGDETFYYVGLSPLFFEALNTPRTNDTYKLPDGSKVKVPFLNGGLFDADDYDDSSLTFTPRLFHNKRDPETPANRGFLDFLGAFNFTIYEDSPGEHTVAVDPEMLGHIFENLLEDNKDKGAFYTPKEIVHYMCQESLIEYLYTKLNPDETATYQELGKKQTDMFGNTGKAGQLALIQKHQAPKEKVSRDKIELLMKKHDTSAIMAHIEAILTALRDVKVCDPAIGSGAFPMGILLEIYHLVEVLFVTDPKVAERVWKIQGWEPAKYKAKIIENSIYGVDIEKGAVNIARLRFWLSLVVDEKKPQPLPNLDYKIVAGNSLLSMFEGKVIDVDWIVHSGRQVSVNKQLLQEQELRLYSLAHKQHLYFNQPRVDKQKLKKEIRNLKVEILINQLEWNKDTFRRNNNVQLPAIPSEKDRLRQKQFNEKVLEFDSLIGRLNVISKDASKDFDFFDWKLDFSEVMYRKEKKNEGFDIVIGNPPYVRQEQFADLKENLRQRYKSFDGRADLYVYFYEKSMELSKRKACLSIISSNKFIKAKYGIPLRNFLSEISTLISIIDFGELPVFENAATFPVIVLAKKIVQTETEFKYTQVKSLKYPYPNISKLVEKNGISLSTANVYSSTWKLANDEAIDLIEKLCGNRKTFKGVYGATIYSGIKSGYNKAFYIDDATKEFLIGANKNSSAVIKKLRSGDDIRKWHIRKSGSHIIYTPSGIDIEKFPAIKAYLIQYKEKLEARAVKQPWWELQQAQNRIGIWDKPKIIYPDICKESRFTIDAEGIYLDMNGFIIPTDDRYLLGLLNSSPIWWFLKKTCAVLGDAEAGGRLRLKRQYIEMIPIPTASKNIVNRVISLVDHCLTNKKLNPTIDVFNTERQLNLIFYKLYSLTFEEASLIEDNRSFLSKEEYESFTLEGEKEVVL